MCGVPAEALKYGMTLRELLLVRKAAGSFAGDPDEDIAEQINQGNVETKTVSLPDGRMISVSNARLHDGGWGPTHDDVSVQRRREVDRDRSQKLLSTLLEAPPVTR